MVEPPPIVAPPLPPPIPEAPKRLTAWGAVGTSAVLCTLVLVVSNFIAIPFIIVGIVNLMAAGKLYGPSASAMITSPTKPAVAEKLRVELTKQLPGTTVIMHRTSETVTITVKNMKGHAEPVEYQAVLTSASKRLGIPGESVQAFVPEIAVPSVEELMADPVILIGSGLSIQVTILIVWLLARKSYFKGDRALPKFHVGSAWRAVAIGVAAGTPVFLFAAFLEWLLNQQMAVRAQSVWDPVVAYPPWAKVGIVLMGVVGAPILEEIFFRGMLIGLFQKAGRTWIGVVFSSILFGVAHMQSVPMVLTITCMGLILGTVYVKTKSLYATMVIHMLNNAASFWMLFSGR